MKLWSKDLAGIQTQKWLPQSPTTLLQVQTLRFLKSDVAFL